MDDREHAYQFWRDVVDRQFTVLSDPDAQVVHAFGLAHPGAGMEGNDIALDTTLFIDADGRERWRHFSESLPDLPTSAETIKHIRETPVASPHHK